MLFLVPRLLAMLGSGSCSLANVPAEFPAMRAAICDKAEQLTADGCSVCPVYTREGGDGLDFWAARGWSFSSFVEGSFTGSGKTEVLLWSLSSCYDHASGMGSAILLRKENGEWKRVAFYHRGEMELGEGSCKKIPGTTHEKDLLVCSYADWGSGGVSVIGFDGEGNTRKQKLLDQLMIPFRETGKPKLCSGVDAYITEVARTRVELRVHHYSYRPGEDDPGCELGESTSADKALFLRSGDQFVPDAATKQLLDKIGPYPGRQ